MVNEPVNIVSISNTPIVDEEDRVNYQMLISEFPELAEQATFKSDGVGVLFTPTPKTTKWRTLREVFIAYYPQIITAKEVSKYNNLIDEFINEPKHTTQQ